MVYYRFVISVLFVLFFLVSSGCGRKYRNIFFFNPNQGVKLETLNFPAVKGVRVVRQDKQISISWNSLSPLEEGVSLVGYNVYRLTSHNFIPRNPLNAAPIQETLYYDKSAQKTAAYIVKGVFKMQGRSKEGPVSLIVKEKSLPPT